ncbi:MAG: nucleotidyltransferase domain-containing protein [Lachnospiraceae bacterium]|nr:nucleotidyltransferase domain-containing protein [Lachnospiraceae bacterium]
MEKIYAEQEIKDITAPVFLAFGINRAWLFGSYARGEASPDSDIDIRIEGGQFKGMFALGRLYDELSNALKKPIDLVTTEALEHRANADRTRKFVSNIREDEKLIYEKCGY